MSTVRFRLDNEQLPLPTSASPYQSHIRSEKESKCSSVQQGGRSPSLYFQTDSQGFAEAPKLSGPGHSPLFQPNGPASSHIVPPVLEHTSPSGPAILVQKVDSSILQHTSPGQYKASDDKPVHEELFIGPRMERSTFHSVDGQRPYSSEHVLLAGPAARNALLLDAPDTDLCLSMVHETRPSYQMKTTGKHPLSPPHLTSLISDEVSKLNFSNSKPSQSSSSFNAYYSPSSSSYVHQPVSSSSPKSALDNIKPIITDYYPLPSSYPRSFSPSSKVYGQSPHHETSAYKLSQKIARETPPPSSNSSPPPPPPPPPLPVASNYCNSPRSRSPLCSSPINNNPIPKTVYRDLSPYGSSRNKPSRTFTDYDPDDILRDLNTMSLSPTRSTSNTQQQHTASSGGYNYQTSYSTTTSSNYSKIPVLPGQRSVVSPRARGLAPAPTDQPIRCPASRGIEANVDAMTIRMMRNMETGYGSAGSTNCAKCGEGIFNNRPGCIAMNKTYHIECFTCQTCNCKLSGSPFYAVDDKQYCEKDYIETLDKCGSCQRPIRDRILRASGKAYHPQCFVCASCFRELDGIPFTVDANNVNYCMQCFHEKFAPRCAACHKPIAPVEGQKETTRVVAMDRSYHMECYVCEDCGMQLSSSIEGHGCYPLDNHLLCKNCNMTRIRKLTSS